MRLNELLVFTTVSSLMRLSIGKNLIQGNDKTSNLKIFSNQTPFPKWLYDFTGLTEWPGLHPPYIPLDFIDMTKIPDYKPYKQGECYKNPRESCSFDCDGCVEHDDVYTCSKLSQTFDDGPSLVTEKLLDELKHNTTFFNLGINTVNNPVAYRKTMEKGHLIGSHTWSHPFLPSLTNEEIIAQLEWSIWAMNATGSHTPKWFRPPYGGIDNRVRAISRQFGLQAVLWDFDTFDWQLYAPDSAFPLRTEQDVYDDVTRWKKINKGLILEHDGSPTTVNVGISINKLIGDDQLTVAQCIGGIDYIRQY
ncbi:hypothetical protein HG535_0E05740 [Zygotorulaspora mrakii]|uniref:chitin deacetylase n=1 Tax=Zygotorulaspora mrakii TaxID=42260 RepID=A0A7H9B4G6_ZYGMR|nr:uncharacterized protein HG535_0E05740 [Zygotorulaspora mrakii]QLG73490.1 hypothetical protein HG535_0E05740 [Zygotorulaspora mrakii]